MSSGARKISERVRLNTLAAALRSVRHKTDAELEQAVTLTGGPTIRIAKPETPVDRVRQVMAMHPVPTDWEQRLRSWSPMSQTEPWLAFRWLEKAERWVVDEMIPDPLIPTEKRHQLAGTPYWAMPPSLQEGRRRMVTAYQWEAYRVHRVWAKPLWCLQGTFGGTPALYTDREAAILKASGESIDPPQAGTMSYAGFDGLAEQKLRERDRLLRYGQSVDRMRRSGSSAVQRLEEAEAEQAFRETFWAYWKETMAPQVDFLTWFGKSDTRTAGVTAGLLRPATEEETQIGHTLEQTFIETGTVPITKAEV